MQTPAPSNSRKRPRSDQYPFEGEACHTISKKQKAIHIQDPKESAAHQDNSPTIPLQRGALIALRRQIAQAARKPQSNQQTRRPATRLAFAEWKRCHQPLKPAHQYLKNCGLEQYKALLSLSKHGGPDLRDIRGCLRPPYRISTNPMTPSQASSISRSRSRRSTKTKPTTEGGASSKSLSPYDRAFQQTLIDYRVFPPHYKDPDGNSAPEPENWDYINERLAQPRSSLSPSKFSKEQHKEFVELDASAAKEADVKKNVIPIIQGKLKDPRTASGEIPFTNLAPLTTDETLVSGNPDFYHGARPEQLVRQIRDELGEYIVPSTQHDLPILPNHVTAAKGPDGSAAVAIRQATYDAYFGARAMNATKSYGQAEPQYDSNAYVFSSIYHNGQLKLYTSHPTAPANPGGLPNYHMNHLRSFAMGDTPQTWRDGATWYRNSIGLAKEFRDEAMRGANEVVNGVQVQAPINLFASNLGESFASSGSQLGLDSLTVDFQVVESALSVTSDDFKTAEGSQDDEDEAEEDEPRSPPAKRSGRSHRQRDSQGKRRNRDDSEDSGSTPASSQEASPQTSSSAAKNGKRKGRVRKKAVR